MEKWLLTEWLLNFWHITYKWLPKLLEGVYLTLELLGISVVVGLFIAIPIGIARSSKKLIIKIIPFSYMFFFRGTPLLIQLFLLYYGAAQFSIVKEIEWLWHYLRNPYWCALIVMTLHTAAYIAEIVRGAISAVPVGEVEAAYSLGMSKAQVMWHIILPRAARIGLPAYSNEIILMLKASSLASTITLLEITGMARTIIARTYQVVEIFLVAAILYLVITFILVMLFRLLERILRVDATYQGI